ncbi:MAG TPA: hypothetical protein VMI33_09235 [Streptosporangiaceae bacterium]|nr:hypothetical protein [Streptosporangiaceae bacterium]
MNEETGAQAPARNISGFLLIAVPSVVAMVLLILAVPYYAGASARITSLYTNLADPADHALTAEVDGYALDEHHNLAAAKLDLSKVVKTQASFDNQLGEITFPPAPDPHVDLLIAADQKRIKLFKLQMQATTLRKLRAFDARDEAANAAVEEQVRIIRQDLGLPAASGALY